jgi:hypothetical protein
VNVDIIGAGLSGLIAATQFPQAQVYEANGPESISHRALLRFRSDTISRLIGIPFRQVMVRKSIWFNGQHCQPSVDLSNMYSRKTNGQYMDRSIWNINPVERFIAPETIWSQLVELVGNRIHWNAAIQPEEIRDEDRQHAFISTIPMPTLLKMLDWQASAPFSFKSIRVDRFRIKGADIYQTVYYPRPEMGVYRASVTGDLLIMEMVCDEQGEVVGTDACFDQVLRSFGVRHDDVELLDLSHRQRFGKIAPMESDRERRQLIYNATVKHHIYSLGRFATWRNILLDDVASDIAVIKRLITNGHYSAAIQHSKE